MLEESFRFALFELISGLYNAVLLVTMYIASQINR